MTTKLIFDTIIYHGSCNDGSTSLWCANYYNNIPEKVSCKAGCNPNIKVENKNILFVDLCPKFEYLIEISKIAKNVVILDHHKSSYDDYQIYKDRCPSNLHIQIDMSKSGCQITWDYFFENISRPWFIDYVADRDLWTWKLPNSKEINQVFMDNNYFDPYYLDNITTYINYASEQINNIVKEGFLLLKIQKKNLDIACSRALEATMTINNVNYNIWLGTSSTTDRSELGNMLTYKLLSNGLTPDFSATWIYEPKTNEWWISLRGHKLSPDLSKIAGYYGGGGHMLASGFTIKLPLSLRDVFLIK